MLWLTSLLAKLKDGTCKGYGMTIRSQNIFWDFLTNTWSILAKVRGYQRHEIFVPAVSRFRTQVSVNRVNYDNGDYNIIDNKDNLEGLITCTCHCPKSSLNITPSMQPTVPWCSHNHYLYFIDGWLWKVKQIIWGHSSSAWWNSYWYQSSSKLRAGSWKKNEEFLCSL